MDADAAVRWSFRIIVCCLLFHLCPPCLTILRPRLSGLAACLIRSIGLPGDRRGCWALGAERGILCYAAASSNKAKLGAPLHSASIWWSLAVVSITYTLQCGRRGAAWVGCVVYRRYRSGDQNVYPEAELFFAGLAQTPGLLAAALAPGRTPDRCAASLRCAVLVRRWHCL